MKMLKFLGRKLIENAGLKVLSLVIAILLWVVVIGIDNPVMVMSFNSIPLHVENADIMTNSGKAFEIPENNQNISISVRAERSVLNQLSRDYFYASIDMAEMVDDVVPVEVRATRFADRISSITPKTSSVHVFVEELIRKQIRIVPNTTGEPAEGYTIGTVKADSNVVRVAGPKSIVETIDHAKVAVDVTGMTADIRANEALVLHDIEENEVSAEELELSITRTNVTAEIYGTKEIGIAVNYSGTPEEGYVVSSDPVLSKESVTITGETEDLDKVSELVIPEYAIDITGASKDVKVTLELTDYLPGNVKMTDEDTSVKVEIPVAKLGSMMLTIPTANLTLENVPEGMLAAFTDPAGEQTVTITGLEQILSSLDPSGVTGTVDVGSVRPPEGEERIVPGIYELPAKIRLPSGVYITEGTPSAAILLQYNDAAAQTAEESEAPQEEAPPAAGAEQQ